MRTAQCGSEHHLPADVRLANTGCFCNALAALAQARHYIYIRGKIMKLGNEIKKALAASMWIGVLIGAALLGAWAQTRSDRQQSGMRSTIAFVSSRHDPAADPAVDPQRAWLAAEIYLMDGDGTNPRRLTENTFADGFPALSPDGKRIVFDSNRLLTVGEPFNT